MNKKTKTISAIVLLVIVVNYSYIQIKQGTNAPMFGFDTVAIFGAIICIGTILINFKRINKTYLLPFLLFTTYFVGVTAYGVVEYLNEGMVSYWIRILTGAVAFVFFLMDDKMVDRKKMIK